VVLFASYNRVQPGDEADSFTELSLLRTETIGPQIHKFGGRMIRWAGDEVLLKFDCVVAAVRCAIAFVEAVSRLNDSLPPDRRIAICIGINLTDIIVEGDEIFGDGVNIASRLKALAEPGTICISGAVHDRIVGKIDFDLIDLGPQDLKNIIRPINVYRIDVDVAMRLVAAASAGRGRQHRCGLTMAVPSQCCHSPISAAMQTRNILPMVSPRISSVCSPAGAPSR